jgi:hypothetical protein
MRQPKSTKQWMVRAEHFVKMLSAVEEGFGAVPTDVPPYESTFGKSDV